MTDHAAFLAAVIAAPDDDLPRLVYADWLEEHGEPARAEFIRVQIAFDAEYGPHEFPINKDGELLRRRMFELLREPRNYVNWTPRLMHTGPGAGIRCESASEVALTGIGFRLGMFRRGFLSRVECTWEAWQTHAAALLAACPIRNAKDGCVRLTTDPPLYVSQPELVGYEHVPCWMFERPNGRAKHLDVWAIHENRREPILRLLAAEWPGVRFELPRDSSADWSTLDSPRRMPELLRGRWPAQTPATSAP